VRWDVRTKTTFVDPDGHTLGETTKLMVPLYRGLLIELGEAEECFTVASTAWNLTVDAIDCRVTVEKADPDLLADAEELRTRKHP
jgi:hypothetical protein